MTGGIHQKHGKSWSPSPYLIPSLTRLFLVFLCLVMQSRIQRKSGRQQGKYGSPQRYVQTLEYCRIWTSIQEGETNPSTAALSFSKSDNISCEASLHGSDALRTWTLLVKLGGHSKAFLQTLWTWFKPHLLLWWLCCSFNHSEKKKNNLCD